MQVIGLLLKPNGKTSVAVGMVVVVVVAAASAVADCERLTSVTRSANAKRVLRV